jgi:hypothetical protein
VVPCLDRNLIAVGCAPFGYHWESDRNAATLRGPSGEGKPACSSALCSPCGC